MRTIRNTVTASLLVLGLASVAHGLPMYGYLESTAANGWQGIYAVHGSDGSVTTGTQAMTLLSAFNNLPLVTTGCTLSSSCKQVNDQTMTYRGLNMQGTASLGLFGALSWVAQGLRVLAGDPSPPIATLVDVTGWIGPDRITATPYDFVFNATLTGTFASVAGGQALSSVRIDFSNNGEPTRSLGYWDGKTRINVGVPVEMGTPIEASEVPEPALLLLLAPVVGFAVWRWRAS